MVVSQKVAAKEDRESVGLPARVRLENAVQRVFADCNGSTATGRQLLTFLRRLHELRLQPFTNPFVAQLIVCGRRDGWETLLQQAGINMGEDGQLAKWDDKTAVRKMALDAELKWHANEEREIPH